LACIGRAQVRSGSGRRESRANADANVIVDAYAMTDAVVVTRPTRPFQFPFHPEYVP